MKTLQKKISIETKKQFELVDITQQVRMMVADSKVQHGTVTVFNPHTTAAVRLNHNEPLLMQDMMKALYRLIPLDSNYSHDLFEVRQQVAVNERSNGHAHVKAFLLGSSETIPVANGAMMLGEKQSLFFVELDGGRVRNVVITILGD